MSKIASHLYQSLAQLVEACYHFLDGGCHVIPLLALLK